MDISLEEALELGVGRQVGLHERHLLGGNVPADIGAILSVLQIVIRAVGAFAQDAKLTLLQALDGGHFLQKRFGREWRMHGP